MCVVKHPCGGCSGKCGWSRGISCWCRGCVTAMPCASLLALLSLLCLVSLLNAFTQLPVPISKWHLGSADKCTVIISEEFQWNPPMCALHASSKCCQMFPYQHIMFKKELCWAASIKRLVMKTDSLFSLPSCWYSLYLQNTSPSKMWSGQETIQNRLQCLWTCDRSIFWLLYRCGSVFLGQLKYLGIFSLQSLVLQWSRWLGYQTRKQQKVFRKEHVLGGEGKERAVMRLIELLM